MDRSKGTSFLPQGSTANKKRAAQATKRRAGLLAMLPEQFTTKEAIEVWHTTDSVASAQVQKMVKHKEIEVVTGHHKPARYRKVSDGA